MGITKYVTSTQNLKLMGTFEIGTRTAVMRAIEELAKSTTTWVSKNTESNVDSYKVLNEHGSKESSVISHLFSYYNIGSSDAKHAIQELEQEKILSSLPNEDASDRYLTIVPPDGSFDSNTLRKNLISLFQD
jgi:hypothetical protein